LRHAGEGAAQGALSVHLTAGAVLAVGLLAAAVLGFTGAMPATAFPGPSPGGPPTSGCSC